MTIFGKPLSQYVEFCKPFLVLVPVAGIIRLALSLGGVQNSTAKWISVTALVGIGVLYYSVRVHSSGFGSYKQLLLISVLLNLAAQVVIIFGIVLAIVTGTPNIYSSPEYAFCGLIMPFCGSFPFKSGRGRVQTCRRGQAQSEISSGDYFSGCIGH